MDFSKVNKIEMFHSDNTTSYWLVGIDGYVGKVKDRQAAIDIYKRIDIEASCFGSLEIYEPFQKHEYAEFVPENERTKPYQIKESDLIDIYEYMNSNEKEAEKKYQEYMDSRSSINDDSAFDFLFN